MIHAVRVCVLLDSDVRLDFVFISNQKYEFCSTGFPVFWCFMTCAVVMTGYLVTICSINLTGFTLAFLLVFAGFFIAPHLFLSLFVLTYLVLL